MASKRRHGAVPRPLKRVEYELRHATSNAEKGWLDLIATARNAAADAWDFLTKTPLELSNRCHPLKGDLATVTINNRVYERWQYEVTSGGRIWYAVDEQTVYLVRVETGHPNETSKQFR